MSPHVAVGLLQYMALYTQCERGLMLVPFHPGIAHALATVAAVLSTMRPSPNLSLSHVIYCINIKLEQNSVDNG